MTEPVACTLTRDGLAAQASRWAALRETAGIERVKTADGLRESFRHEPAVEDELRALVAAENECCAWASWLVEREDGTLVMRATSSGTGIATLHAMVDGVGVRPLGV